MHKIGTTEGRMGMIVSRVKPESTELVLIGRPRWQQPSLIIPSPRSLPLLLPLRPLCYMEMKERGREMGCDAID